MREIKFMAQSKQNKEWVEGYYALLGKDENVKHYIIQNCSEVSLFSAEEENMYFNDVEINPDTLCQFIGKFDEGGKKIYENDIVYCPYKNCSGTIEWDEDSATFAIEWEDGCWEDFNLFVDSSDLIVLGNKFD